MINLQNVTKTFRLDTKTVVTPIHNVDLNITEGEIIVVIGRSGSGKTTLLNLIAGLVRPTDGHVLFNNIDLETMTDKQLSALRSQKMGFIFQFPSLFPNLTVLENITLPIMFTIKSKRRENSIKATTLLDNLGLKDKHRVFPRQLSAGEQKRVALARALINNTPVILADELTSDLDIRTEQEIMEILQDINSKGVTIIMVTHNLNLVSYATRAFITKNGNLEDISSFKNLPNLESHLITKPH